MREIGIIEKNGSRVLTSKHNKNSSLRVALAILIGIGFISTATLALASHQWSKYHWKRDSADPLILSVGDGHTQTGPGFPNWGPIFDDVVVDWDFYSGQFLGFDPDSVPADIDSFNDDYGDTGWLGLASISITRGRNKHIVKGTSRVNDFYVTLAGYDGFDEPIEWQHVLCQEIGHTFGLDHNRNGSTGGEPDDTCMNDAQRPLRYPTPNIHDTELLDEMYAHDHGDSGGGGGGGGGGGRPGCHPVRGCAVVTHVTWAENYETEQKMFDASDLVVEARVILTRSLGNVGRADRSVPMTSVKLAVLTSIKGNGKASIMLEQTGGEGFIVREDPSYHPGQNYLLYLRQTDDNTFRIVNQQGRIGL